jgi:hypothetical protein
MHAHTRARMHARTHARTGETLVTEMWQLSPTSVVFQTRVQERQGKDGAAEVVLSNCLMTLHPPANPKAKL